MHDSIQLSHRSTATTPAIFYKMIYTFNLTRENWTTIKISYKLSLFIRTRFIIPKTVLCNKHRVHCTYSQQQQQQKHRNDSTKRVKYFSCHSIILWKVFITYAEISTTKLSHTVYQHFYQRVQHYCWQFIGGTKGNKWCSDLNFNTFF